MPREKADYRDNLALLNERFGAKATAPLSAVADYVGVDYRTLLAEGSFPVIKCGRCYVVPLVGLAKWLS